MILADIFLSIIGLVALLIASITDLRTKEVPDWLNFSVIVSALGIRAIHSIISSDYMYLLYGIIGFAAMFFLGMLLYYGRLWGGGDTKLLMGLGALFGTTPYFVMINYPFIAVLLINIIIVGSVYSLAFAIGLFIKNTKATINEMKSQTKRMAKTRLAYLLASFVALAMFFIFEDSRIKVLSIALAGFFIFYIHLLIFIRSVEKVGMNKVILVSQLTEGDWIAKDIIINGKLICSKKSLGIEKKQIEAIKKAGIKRIMVKEGVAFVPSFLLGLVITFIFGSLIF